LGAAIQAATAWLKDMAAKIANLKLPDWLTPGSPTPFEMGLRGIGKAIKDLNNFDLPRLKAGVDIQAPTGPLGMAIAGAGAGGSSQTNYNLTINEAGARGNVVNDFNLLRAMAGA
jgi:hypothetical protein